MYRLLFLLFVATLPFQMALSPFPGVDAHSSRFFSLAIGILWLISSLRTGALVLPKPMALFSLSALFVAVIFSLVFAENPVWGLRKLAFLLSFLPILFVAYSFFQGGDSRARFAKVLVFGASLSALIALFESMLPFAIGLQPVLYLWREIFLPFFLGATFSGVVSEYSSLLVNIGGETILRGSAFFPDPHIASFFFGMSVPFAIALNIHSSGKQRWLFGISALLLLLADMATFSRGGFVAILLVGMGFLPTVFPMLVRRFGGVFLAGCALSFLAIVLPNPLSSRLLSIASDTDTSNIGRIAIWQEAMVIISEHPIHGVGLGNYSLAVKPSADYREPRYAHNLFLDISAEIGTPIAVFLCIAILLLIVRGFSSLDIFMRSAGASLSIFFLHSLFETPIYSVHILPLFLSLIAMLL